MVWFLGGKQILSGRGEAGQGSILHSHAPSQCYRTASHGTCPGQHTSGHSYPLEETAGLQCSLASRNRPCRYCHPGQGGRAACQGRYIQVPTGQGEVSGESMGMEGAVWWKNNQPAKTPGILLRLGQRKVYHG